MNASFHLESLKSMATENHHSKKQNTSNSSVTACDGALLRTTVSISI